VGTDSSERTFLKCIYPTLPSVVNYVPQLKPMIKKWVGWLKQLYSLNGFIKRIEISFTVGGKKEKWTLSP
jgi:hypothetical protein